MLNTMKILTKKIVNLKLVIASEYQKKKKKKMSVKGYTQKWSEEIFLNSTIKSTVPCTYAISEPSVRSFYEKVIKGKGDKLYVKWKGCDNLFNSWIKSKDLA